MLQSSIPLGLLKMKKNGEYQGIDFFLCLKMKKNFVRLFLKLNELYPIKGYEKIEEEHIETQKDTPKTFPLN